MAFIQSAQIGATHAHDTAEASSDDADAASQDPPTGSRIGRTTGAPPTVGLLRQIELRLGSIT